MLQQNFIDIQYIIPEILLCLTFGLMLVVDNFWEKKDEKMRVAVVGVVGILLVLWSLAKQTAIVPAGESMYLFSRMIVLDGFSIFFKWIFGLTTILALLMAMHSKEIDKQNQGEFYTITVFICLGMFFLASSTHLLMIFLSFEMISILSYVLAGYLKDDPKSSESGIKYVIYGAFTTGVMIYGMSLLYGLTGSLELMEIRAAVQESSYAVVPVTVILLFIYVGMFYKIAAVPFHMWSPDVYEGAPTVATAFFSVGPKAAGFAVLIRFFLMISGAHEDVDWHHHMMALAVLTMTIGNFTALRQENVKRMLAYSSIAHAGYLLMGLSVISADGRSAILFYFAAYMIMNMGAFLVVLALENVLGSSELKDFSGMGSRAPLAGAALVVFLVSLTGLPPTVGFIGKFFLFKAVVEQQLYILALIAVLNSVVSLVYYMRVAKVMYLDKPQENIPEAISISPLYSTMLFLLVLPVIYLGLFFQAIYELTIRATMG